MNDELAAIFNRIANGQFTDADIESLQQFLESGDHEVKAQFAKFNTNIANGKNIHIGDNYNLELSDEMIQAITAKISNAKFDNENRDKLIHQSKPMNLTKNKPVYIYFSSCGENKTALNGIEKNLQPLEIDGIIKILHTDKISAGTNRIVERNEQLRKADIILLLVSIDYIVSLEHRNVEVKMIMEKYNLDTKVIPIIIDDCDWSREAYKDLQPITSNKIRKKDIYSEIANAIKNEINKIKSIKNKQKE
ncbi:MULTISPECIES: TIR domain-containing protein [Pseudanabaena]|uniref:TIR domain-containing protein n=2 Tax=Pseudanabaena TaxID=1152 RepID=L8N9H6_9CYAN|nr:MULTISPECIES: TIR domain-containing protein [Pseudanabaena]ELS34873.1 hypothetical protein Pse7429DRAFT_0062 [Pseudanabaena biceps PCC 7429]MDG3492992.1 toll/interleukin-1 receptor domain-containing protein [Pseudanabaena catenata USMAC16]